jgi:MerR family transcriptional regulator, heat shock protein HspR
LSHNPENQPCFHISIVSEMLGLHPQTIRNYERIGLVRPSRTNGNMRLFSAEDIDRLRKIQSYTNMGVNLAGVEIIIKILDQMQEMQIRMEEELDQATRDLRIEKENLQFKIKFFREELKKHGMDV